VLFTILGRGFHSFDGLLTACFYGFQGLFIWIHKPCPLTFSIAEHCAKFRFENVHCGYVFPALTYCLIAVDDVSFNTA